MLEITQTTPTQQQHIQAALESHVRLECLIDKGPGCDNSSWYIISDSQVKVHLQRVAINVLFIPPTL